MKSVVIREGTRYVQDAEGLFRQACGECGRLREEGAAGCCGVPFPKHGKQFFITKREAPTVQVVFPDRCPHCGGAATQKRTVSRAMHVSHRRQETVIFEFGACQALKNPLIYYLGLILCAFVAVVAGLIGAFAVLERPAVTIGAAVVVGLVLAGFAWLWRRYSALRFVSWDQGEMRFRVRDPRYAVDLASANGGFVRGMLAR